MAELQAGELLVRRRRRMTERVLDPRAREQEVKRGGTRGVREAGTACDLKVQQRLDTPLGGVLRGSPQLRIEIGQAMLDIDKAASNGVAFVSGSRPLDDV